MLQLPHVGIILSSGHTLDGLGTFRNGRHNFVRVTYFGICDVLVLEVDGIGESLDPRCFGMVIVRTVMVFGRKKIPAID